MTVVAVGSLAGAPGATTLALELARRATGRVLLVEADGDGGRLAAWLDLAVRPGLTDLAASCRMGLADPDELWHFAQADASQLPIVVAHPAADAVGAALRASAAPLGEALRAASARGADLVVDIGRFRPGSPVAPLAAAADHRLVVTRPTLDGVALLRHRSELLQAWGGCTVVCVGSRPYAAADIARVAGHDVLAVASRGRGRRARRKAEASLDRLAGRVFAGAAKASEELVP